MSKKIQRVIAVYFSPTGGTRQIASTLASQIADYFLVPCETIDFTLPEAREKEYRFGPEDFAVFASPTYAGKLPNKILPFFKSGFQGGGARAAAVVTFGNRSFDNSLAELAACLRASGFRLLGGGAFAARHCFSKVLAAGRPDEKDLEELKRFGESLCAKAAQESDASGKSDDLELPGDADAPYYRPRGIDGEFTNFLKAKPVTDPERCDKCMLCVKLCPVGSVDPEDPAKVNGICIKCHACVRLCPKEAKYFDDPQFLSHKEMLEKTYTRRADPVWFV